MLKDENGKPVKCKAKAKRYHGKGQCQNAAMDNGYCRYHGGRESDALEQIIRLPSIGLSGAPIKHGRKSKYLHHTLANKYDAIVNDTEFTDLREEIEFVRIAIAEFSEKFVNEDGLLLSNESIGMLTALTDQLRRLSDTYVKIENLKKFAMTPDEVRRIIENVAAIVAKYVPEEMLDAAIAELNKIPVR